MNQNSLSLDVLSLSRSKKWITKINPGNSSFIMCENLIKVLKGVSQRCITPWLQAATVCNYAKIPWYQVLMGIASSLWSAEKFNLFFLSLESFYSFSNQQTLDLSIYLYHYMYFCISIYIHLFLKRSFSITNVGPVRRSGTDSSYR